MPSRATIEAAMAELALQGLSISVEHIRGLTGGSPRDICKHLREIKTKTPPPPAPPALTLADVREGAKQCVMRYLQPHPLTVLDRLNAALERAHRYSVADLWNALLPACTDAQDVQAVHWKLETTQGKLVWTSGEPARLDRIWQRCVIATIGRISPQERAAYEREQWAKLAQQRREADALDRARQLH